MEGMTPRRPRAARGLLRRAVAALLAGALVTVGLTACGDGEPRVVAYVGDTRITVDQVDEVTWAWYSSWADLVERSVAQLREVDADDKQVEDLRRQRMASLDEQLPHVRNQVLAYLVLTEAGRRYADANGISVPQPRVAQVRAQMPQLPEDHPYVQLRAEGDAVLEALRSAATPTQPSEEDQREVYRNLFGDEEPVIPFEEVQPFLGFEQLGQAVGMRNLLQEVLESQDVRLAPGYEVVHPVLVDVQGVTSWLGVRIAGPSSVVSE